MTEAAPISTTDGRALTIPGDVAPGTFPVGVAPLAATVPVTDVPKRVRRSRMVIAATVTGAMAMMPLAGPTALARERDRHEMRVASAELFLRQKAAEIEVAEAPPEAAPSQRAASPTESRPSSAAPRGRSDAAPAPAVPAAAAADDPARAGGTAERQDEVASAESDRDEVAAEPAEPAEPATATPAPKEPTPIAAVSGIRLLVPSMQTALVGFHEAAMPGSLPMASVAPLTDNHNPGAIPEIAKTQPHQVAPVMVLPTRARAQAPSTAIDIAVPAGEEILAPLDGTVTAVLPYTLYGQHADVRVEIEPTGRPDLRVVVLHVSDVGVEVGDVLTGGETVIAGTATQFPFESQIDRFAEAIVGRALPHVHVEVRPAG